MLRDSLIHIVDDDEAVLSALQLLLRSFGCRVRSFASASAFLDALAQEAAPDCLLLDLDMPVMNGAELLEALKARQSGIPVIIVTGRGDTPLAARARQAGARDVLGKPFGEDELQCSIKQVIAGRGQHPPTVQ